MNDKPDLDHLRQWIGRSTQASDIVTAQLVKGLRATLFMAHRPARQRRDDSVRSQRPFRI